MFRTLRSVPVMVGIARDMEEICPDAWMLNVTNPMTQLVRAMTRETAAKVVGLCHEVTICRFYLSMWLGESFLDLEPTVVGVNHLPIMTGLRVRGVDDGFDRLRGLLDGPAAARAEQLPYPIPDGIGMGPSTRKSDEWTKAGSARRQPGEDRAVPTLRRVARLERPAPLRVLPGPAHRAVGMGRALGRAPHDDRGAHRARGSGTRPTWRRGSPPTRCRQMPSGEMVAPLIDAMLRDKRRNVPAQPARTPGRRRASPTASWSRRCASPTASGVRGGEPAVAPGVLGEYVRRMTAVDELSVQAALTGKRDDVIAALLADPLSSRIDYDDDGAHGRRDAHGHQALAPAVRVSRRGGSPRQSLLARNARRLATFA